MVMRKFTFPRNPATTIIDGDFNPANPGMVIALQTDGGVLYKGAPPQITGVPYSGSFFTSRGIQIFNWTTGQGYHLLASGLVQGLNGLSNPSNQHDFGNLTCVAFSMNPNMSGDGWVLGAYGDLFAIGGAPAPPGPQLALSPGIGRKLFVDWATMKFIVLDGWGVLHMRAGGGQGGTVLNQPDYKVVWTPGSPGGGPLGFDIARDILVHDIAGKWGGYTLDGYGGLSPFYSAPDAKPQSLARSDVYFPGSDVARAVFPLSGNDRIGVLLADGRYFDWDAGAGTYTITSVTAPTGVQTQRRPVVTWKPHQTGLQVAPDRLYVKVFNDTQYNDPNFDPLTSAAAFNSGIVSKAQTLDVFNSWQLSSGLQNGTFKAYVQSGKLQSDGSIDFSIPVASPVFTLASTVPLPTNVTPANGAVVDTDIPVLGCTLTADSLGSRVMGQWQLAQDVAFTVGLREVSDQLGDFRTSGNTSEPVPSAMQLSQGTWFVRARELSETLDTSNGWTVANSFQVSHPPSTSGYSPTGGQARPYEAGGVVTLSWTFSDSSPVDTQSGYQLVVEDNGTGILLADTGQVNSTLGNGPVAIPPTYTNRELRWKVRVFDSDGIAGPFSAYQIFKVVESANVTITAPTNGGVVSSPQPTITWTYSASGRAQIAYRITVQRVSDQVTVYDSTQLQGSTQQHKLSRPALANSTNYYLTVTVYDDGRLASTRIINFSTSWIPPSIPGSIVLNGSNYEDLGYVSIAWNDAVQDIDFRAWRIYRATPIGVYIGVWTYVDEMANGPYLDYSAEANETVYYSVVQVASRFGTDIESPKESSHSLVTTGSHYWLVSNQFPALSMRLAHVTADSYTNEYERESYVLKGRGRKVDQGVRVGVSGTLVCELRNLDGGRTAREQRQALEHLQATKAEMYLRNPFGDVWKVSPTNVQIERVPGVGIQEVVKVTIPYEEVV